MDVLFWSVLSGNIEAVEHVINNSTIDLNQSRHGEDVLSVAVKQNDREMVNCLVKNGANVNNKKVKTCALFVATSKGYTETAALLIELGADLEEGWISGTAMPPLHFAIACLNLEMVVLLVSKGADVNKKGNYVYQSALHALANFFRGKTTEEQREETKVMVKIAVVLLNKGADVNAIDCHGRTPLLCAIDGITRPELAKLFIQEGAEVKFTRDDGSHFDFIGLCVIYKCPDLARMCLERGCDYNIHDRRSFSTPYHNSLKLGSPASVKVFWQFGCPFDLPEDPRIIINFELQLRYLEMKLQGPTKHLLEMQKKFIKGIENGCVKSVRESLNNGAEPKGCSMVIPSTLHYVVAKDHYELTKLLLENGVAVNSLNKHCETPLSIAIKKGNVQVCKVLLQFGACFNYRNPNTDLVIKSEKIQDFLKKIHNSFMLVKKNQMTISKKLKKYYFSQNQEDFFLMMNCVNRRGLTLIGEALRLNRVELAKELMILRLEHNDGE